MTWTPYEIEIVLHHRSSGAPFPRAEAPLYWPTVKKLMDFGILTRRDCQSALHSTPLGDALVALWCSTPLPVQRFVDPRFGEAA